jgi:translation initiation factor IF-2
LAKNLKLHIKNTQLAEAINLRGLKAKLSRKKGTEEEEEKPVVEPEAIIPPEEALSVAEQTAVEEPAAPVTNEPEIPLQEPVEIKPEEPVFSTIASEAVVEAEIPPVVEKEPIVEQPLPIEQPLPVEVALPVKEAYRVPVEKPKEFAKPTPVIPSRQAPPPPFLSAARNNPEQLGPVFGRELPSMRPSRREPLEIRGGQKPVKPAYEPLRDRRPPAPKPGPAREGQRGAPVRRLGPPSERERGGAERPRPPRGEGQPQPQRGREWNAGEIPSKEDRPVRRFEGGESGRKAKPKGVEGKPKGQESKVFIKRSEGHGGDARLRHGIAVEDDDEEGTGWRKKRLPKGFRGREQQPEVTRPTKIKVRIPITVKDLAAAMKLKASQLISSLFMQGTTVTLNDVLTDETMIQLLGHEVGCEVEIDTSEEERLRITDKTIAEEIQTEQSGELSLRPPIVTFMGHVDHGKTSLIDAIRKTHLAEGEVGAITQHIGAFTCSTKHGPIAIIDTPGHEAFTAMRERGADLTDIVVLVIAGDEGMKEQTIEALRQAKESKATIIVAINKSDKPNFDQDRVFRQLADQELLPEAWGGHIITVACSALTGAGIDDLLEMIALQSEVLELKANPRARARGTVIESEMGKGVGAVATVLVQNGTLHVGDCLVFGSTMARIKAMRDDLDREMAEAGPSTPVRISGLSGLPDAGEEFIVVKSEKEARDIADSRREGLRQMAFQIKRRVSLENMMEKASTVGSKKILTIILRADVQGSLEALKTALLKIESQKVEVDIISSGVGEISESDIQLASASKATIIGFHTNIEAHAEPMVKGLGVSVRLHEIIYHAQDDVRDLMRATLDKIPEQQERGKAEVKAIFKSSQLGLIAGCMVMDGAISRNCNVRVRRGDEILWNGPISSLKRFKEDAKEVTKGIECGIVLQGFSAYQEGDMLEGYEIVYHEQDL